MIKKADPGYLGNPVHGIWPQNSDPPLYHTRSWSSSHRSHSNLMGDFWNFPHDTNPEFSDIKYPPPNAWRHTRFPAPLGNIPSFEDIYEGDEDLLEPWYGSPRSYRYHGNNFMIDGPYGDSNSPLADNFFYNNLIPIYRWYRTYPLEKALRDKQHSYINKRSPTLPLPRRSLRPSLWDFLGESMGPNSGYYGIEPSTGGGGAGLLGMASSQAGANSNTPNVNWYKLYKRSFSE